MTHLVISFVTPDRPGLVDTLSDIVNQHNGNWQASSLHHLSGLFAGIIEVGIDPDHIENLTDELQSIPGLSLTAKTSKDDVDPQHANLVIELTANDRNGIVQEISSVVHHQGGNLLKLVSKHEAAPHTGQSLFKARITIAVSESESDDLVAALEQLSDDIMLDISN